VSVSGFSEPHGAIKTIVVGEGNRVKALCDRLLHQ
jgi:hypothetical protein